MRRGIFVWFPATLPVPRTLLFAWQIIDTHLNFVDRGKEGMEERVPGSSSDGTVMCGHLTAPEFHSAPPQRESWTVWAVVHVCVCGHKHFGVVTLLPALPPSQMAH